MKPLFIQNIPIDEKRISFIEKVVTRLARKSIKKITGVITPYPISNCVIGEDIRGDVLKYMFPLRGKINKGLIVLGSKPKEGIVVGLTLTNDLGSNAKSYVITKKTMAVDPNVDVYSGDRLTISVHPTNEETKVSEIWIAFTWVPLVEDAQLKSCLIEELEKTIDQVQEQ